MREWIGYYKDVMSDELSSNIMFNSKGWKPSTYSNEKGKTKKIDLIGYKIECHDPKDGNIAVVLKTHNMFKAFAGSYVTDKIAGLYGL